MNDALLKRVSKRMALLLRHAPERAGLTLDPEGFVHVDDLVQALRLDIPEADAAIVCAVVAHVEPHKQRYSIVGGCVRANYGHSLAERVAHIAATPPDVLMHGTGEAAVASILTVGLRPMGRQYVHLTPDRYLAASVGTRHGRLCLIKVDAKAACAGGVAFYKANCTFWLADHVPPSYLRVE
ncbi:MAG: RNA 2'-phosphotransferase [Pseudomonadota bacterium]